MTREASDPAWFVVVESGVEIDVLAVPRSSRSRIVGVHDDRLKVQLAAAPADGEANAALILVLAKSLKVKRSAVALVSGHGSRRKRVRVDDVSETVVRSLVSE